MNKDVRLRFDVYLLRFVWGAFLLVNSSLETWAQAPHHQQPFGVKVEGLRSQTELLKIQAQLKAARDTRYCRGANIPVPKGEWQCEKPGPGIERCQREYRCARIKANLSRVTETRKYLAKARELGAPSGEYEIEFYPEPFLPHVADPQELRRARLKVSSRQTKAREAKPSEIKEIKRPSQRRQIKKEQKPELKSSAELIEARQEQLDFLGETQAQDSVEARQDDLDFLGETQDPAETRQDDLDFLGETQAPQDPVETQQDDLDFLADDNDEQAPIEPEENPLDFLSDSDSEDLETLVPEEQSSESSQDQAPAMESEKILGLGWKKISTSWVNSTDQFGESKSQFNIAWTPEYAFTKSWSLKGQLGGHVYTALTAAGEESFYVIDTFAHLQFSFWKNWQVSAGLGMQQWNTEQGQSLSGIALGFSRKVNWGFVERLYFQEVSLVGEDEVSVSELRFGALLSF